MAESVARRNQQFLLRMVRQIREVYGEPRGRYMEEEEWGECGLRIYWGACGFPNGPSWYLRCEEDGRVVLWHPEDLSSEYLDSLERSEDGLFEMPLGVPESERVLLYQDALGALAWLSAMSSSDVPLQESMEILLD